jgi:hypothetical protein
LHCSCHAASGSIATLLYCKTHAAAAAAAHLLSLACHKVLLLLLPICHCALQPIAVSSRNLRLRQC